MSELNAKYIPPAIKKASLENSKINVNKYDEGWKTITRKKSRPYVKSSSPLHKKTNVLKGNYHQHRKIGEHKMIKNFETGSFKNDNSRPFKNNNSRDINNTKSHSFTNSERSLHIGNKDQSSSKNYEKENNQSLQKINYFISKNKSPEKIKEKTFEEEFPLLDGSVISKTPLNSSQPPNQWCSVVKKMVKEQAEEEQRQALDKKKKNELKKSPEFKPKVILRGCSFYKKYLFEDESYVNNSNNHHFDYENQKKEPFYYEEEEEEFLYSDEE